MEGKLIHSFLVHPFLTVSSLMRVRSSILWRQVLVTRGVELKSPT